MSGLTLIMLVLVGLMAVGVFGSLLSVRWYGPRRPQSRSYITAAPTIRREELCDSTAAAHADRR